MSEKHFIRRPLPLLLLSVHCPNTKIKTVEVHPVKPWVVVVDNNNNHVSVFDYNNNKCVLDSFSPYSHSRSEATTTTTTTRAKSTIGTIRQVLFTDQAAVCHYSLTTTTTTTSQQPSVSSLFSRQQQQQQPLASQSGNKNNNNNNNALGIAIVCEFQIIFLDLITGATTTTTLPDLLASTTNVSSSLAITGNNNNNN